MVSFSFLHLAFYSCRLYLGLKLCSFEKKIIIMRKICKNHKLSLVTEHIPAIIQKLIGKTQLGFVEMNQGDANLRKYIITVALSALLRTNVM